MAAPSTPCASTSPARCSAIGPCVTCTCGSCASSPRRPAWTATDERAPRRLPARAWASPTGRSAGPPTPTASCSPTASSRWRPRSVGTIDDGRRRGGGRPPVPGDDRVGACCGTTPSRRSARCATCGLHVQIVSNIDDEQLEPMIDRLGLRAARRRAPPARSRPARASPTAASTEFALAKAGCEPADGRCSSVTAPSHDVAGPAAVGMRTAWLAADARTGDRMPARRTTSSTPSPRCSTWWSTRERGRATTLTDALERFLDGRLGGPVPIAVEADGRRRVVRDVRRRPRRRPVGAAAGAAPRQLVDGARRAARVPHPRRDRRTSRCRSPARSSRATTPTCSARPST